MIGKGSLRNIFSSTQPWERIRKIKAEGQSIIYWIKLFQEQQLEGRRWICNCVVLGISDQKGHISGESSRMCGKTLDLITVLYQSRFLCFNNCAMITQDVTLWKKVRIKESSLFLRWKSLSSALGYELPSRLLTTNVLNHPSQFEWGDSQHWSELLFKRCLDRLYHSSNQFIESAHVAVHSDESFKTLALSPS